MSPWRVASWLTTGTLAGTGIMFLIPLGLMNPVQVLLAASSAVAAYWLAALAVAAWLRRRP